MISELELKSESFLKTSKSKDPLGITSAKRAVEMSLKVKEAIAINEIELTFVFFSNLI
jgi:hypothetical protein